MWRGVWKKHILFENAPRHICTVIHLSCFLGIFIKEAQLRLLATLNNVFFWPGELDLWPMTLTFKHDLHILPLDLHAENQVHMSVRSAVRVVTHTHTYTDTLTISKLLHPSLTGGVLNCYRWAACLDNGYTKKHLIKSLGHLVRSL